jgi:hypothetical protein
MAGFGNYSFGLCSPGAEGESEPEREGAREEGVLRTREKREN